MEVIIVGSINMDMTISTPKIPAPGETVLGEAVAFHSGGKGGNQAVAAAQSGACARMIGNVGRDSHGKQLLQSLSQKGVITESVDEIGNVPSGCAFIEVDKAGENSIVVVQGANAFVSEEQIDRNDKFFRKGNILLVQNEIPLYSVVYCLKKARACGMLTVWNPAPFYNIPESCLPLVDFVTPNEKELALLCGDSGDQDYEKLVTALLGKGIANVIATLGKKGSFLGNRSGIYHFPAPTMNAVDTTGAGDCFNGYFAGCLAQGLSVGESINMATAAAALSVTKQGAQESIPTFEEAKALRHSRKFSAK